MNKWTRSFIAVSMSAAGACATVAPKELISARQEYDKASRGPAGQYAPTNLYQAKQALDRANQSFATDPDAPVTRDYAYIALRKAQLAETQGKIEVEDRQKIDAANAVAQLNQKDLTNTKKRLSEAQQMGKDQAAELAKTNDQLHQTAEQLQKANEELQQQKDALAKLALEKGASVKEDERGTILTLSGSVLFASGKAELLPSAQDRLTQVASALSANPKQKLIIEGHTDSMGSEKRNQQLSLDRAQAVKDYLVAHGLSEEKTRVLGLGKTRPIADNTTAEGRANNRRVEIVILKPESNPDASPSTKQ